MTDTAGSGAGEPFPWLQNGPATDDTVELAEETQTHEPEPLRFRLISFDQISLPTATDYAVKGILPRTGVVAVWGPYSCGKSFWALDLVMHIALGWEYRGRLVKQGAVVYCAFEGQAGFAKRIEAFRQHRVSEDVEDVPFYLMPLSIDLIQDLGQLIDDMKAQHVKPNVVVLDTLARSMSGDENSNADMGRYFAAADAIRATFDCLVIVVHHSGYDDSHPRGGTALASNSEGLIKIYRDALDNVCSLVQKYKDGEVGDATTSGLEQVVVGTDDEDEEITSCVLIEVDAVASDTNSSKVRMTNAERTALAALSEAIDMLGEAPPPSNYAPNGVKAVTESQWRTYAYDRGISTGEERAKQKAFKRGYEGLIARKMVGTWQGYYWLVH